MNSQMKPLARLVTTFVALLAAMLGAGIGQQAQAASPSTVANAKQTAALASPARVSATRPVCTRPWKLRKVRGGVACKLRKATRKPRCTTRGSVRRSGRGWTCIGRPKQLTHSNPVPHQQVPVAPQLQVPAKTPAATPPALNGANPPAGRPGGPPPGPLTRSLGGSGQATAARDIFQGCTDWVPYVDDTRFWVYYCYWNYHALPGSSPGIFNNVYYAQASYWVGNDAAGRPLARLFWWGDL